MTSGPSAKDPTKRHWYIYDAWNRLVEVWEDDGDSVKEITGGSPDDTLIARYEYDGLNRRIAKQVYSGGSLDHTLDMYYNENWQILEIRENGNANPIKQYVWHTTFGGCIDAPAIRYYDPDTDGSNIATQYFTHDANMNVTALTDDTGAVIERYDYTTSATTSTASATTSRMCCSRGISTMPRVGCITCGTGNIIRY